MNKQIFKKLNTILSCVALSLPGALSADVLDLSDAPLAVSTTVEPNVMLLMDNSGSMRNIVWDIDRVVTKPDKTTIQRTAIAAAPAPYDDTVTYPSWSNVNRKYDYSLAGTWCLTRVPAPSSTKCITLPDPYRLIESATTWWAGNYLNYIFENYPGGTNLTDSSTYYWFPNISRLGAVQESTVNLVTTVPNVRFGLASFVSSYGGDINASCGSDPGTLTTKIEGLRANGATPLAESFYEITRYFRGLKGFRHSSSNNNSSLWYTSPIQYRCQQNFVVVLTDGYPTGDTYFPSSSGDPDIESGCNSSDGSSATPPCLPDWDELHPATTTLPYPQYSDGPAGSTLYLDDLAKFGYDLDLRDDPPKTGANTSDNGLDLAKVSFDDLSNNKKNEIQNLKTFTIGFAISNQMLADAAYYGQDPALDGAGNPKKDINGNIIKKDGYFTANDTTQLATAFGNIIQGIQQTTGSAAAVAASTGFISTETLLFQALYDSNNWEGRLRAYQLDPLTRQLVKDTNGDPKVLWEAGEQLTNQNYKDRFIMTYGKKGGVGSPIGYLFDWSNFDTNIKTALTYVDNTNSTTKADTTDDQYIYEYMQGDRSRELLDAAGNARTGGIFRSRGKLVTIDVPDPLDATKTIKKIVEYNSNILGDIVNSSPVYVGRPNMPYRNKWNESFEYKLGNKTVKFTQTAPENATAVQTYSDFRKYYSGSDKSIGYDRNDYATLYLGANDGMLHAFNSTNTANGGTEKFAYVPSPVIQNMKNYSDPAYSHKYFADGAPNVIDAFYTNAAGKHGWHTTLAAGLNNGGQGVYVLDITDPKNDFGKSESSASKLVQWEFTDADDADLGFTYAQPAIVRMANGKWAAIFGNGYNNTADDDGDSTTTNDSTTGNAVLYIAFLDGPGSDGKWDLGTDYIKIDTGVGLDDDINNPTHANYHGGGSYCSPKNTAVAGGSGPFDINQSQPNGMSTVSVVDINNDFIADFIYAGDLYGNLWKFDVRDKTTTKWASHIKGTSASNTPIPLFQARSGTCPQPITAQPAVIQAQGEYMVLFGTGKFIETSDTDTLNETRTQTFYGLLDKTESQVTPTPHISKSYISSDWVIQEIFNPDGTTFQFTNSVTSATNSETTREVTKNGRNDGSYQSWFLELPTKGERVIYEPFVRGIFSPKVIFVTAIPTEDACSAGGTSWLMEVDARDGSKTEKAVFDLNYDGKVDSADNDPSSNVLNGWKLPGIATAPTVIATDSVDIKVMSTSTGSLELRQEDAPDADGRQSWRQIK